MARASGLALVEHNDPLAATTYGTGELIAAALDHGCRRVIVGVGGSATVDGGLGALDALGWSLRGADVVVACDVTTTFLDAPAIFGPQKGASPADVAVLEERLRELARPIRRATASTSSPCPARAPRAAWPAGSQRSARASCTGSTSSRSGGFAARAGGEQRGDHGRGKGRCLDADGKAVARVLDAARAAGRPAAVIAGAIAPGVELDVPASSLSAMGSGDTFRDAAVLVEAAAFDLAPELIGV